MQRTRLRLLAPAKPSDLAGAVLRPSQKHSESRQGKTSPHQGIHRSSLWRRPPWLQAPPRKHGWQPSLDANRQNQCRVWGVIGLTIWPHYDYKPCQTSGRRPRTSRATDGNSIELRRCVLAPCLLSVADIRTRIDVHVGACSACPRSVLDDS